MFSLSSSWRFAAVLAALAGSARGAPPVDFQRDVRPILANRCFTCHGPDEATREADLRLDRPGASAIVPGQPEASELLRRVASQDETERMPPPDTGKPLAPAEIDALRRWIAAGATYTQHWAYVRPQRAALPAVADAAWVRNPIDAFVLTRLEAEGLRPSPEADRATLVRRASLDLIGLPPTLEEVDAFLADGQPGAYERLVDRLLASPAYGEHWARMWLDLARYADSGGYVSDEPRSIWAYRDYVIRALNANKPFDRFTVEQLAGDLLPDPTEEQLIATAFHRNTPTNTEGGTDDEEFRNVAVVDRVNTTGTVWLGTTLACAQCHTHKYDPITNEEYFRFFAIFNNTEDADRQDEAPVYSFYTPQRQQAHDELAAAVAELEAKTRTPEEEQEYVERKKQLDADKPFTVPILRELPPERRRVTRIQHRGNFLDLGHEVLPGAPAVFPPLPDDRPADRLALARWLVSPEHPLTARVTVNHFWERLFGTGLVATADDFGTQGELPSHPELLDWLAVEFIESGWDVKRLLRLMVTSAAYRQSSAVAPALAERDPDNRLLARGPRFRLDAEVIRDQALAVAGLLSRTMYGPPVRPPQPAFGLSAAFGPGMDWKNSEGEDRYRRGLYTNWRRTNPYPSMVTFDAPSREVCTASRARTNTPLQALVTLNDPVYVEAAQALARRMVSEGGATPAERAAYGLRLTLARRPHDAERDRLVALRDAVAAGLAHRPDDALKLATVPLGPLPDDQDAVELASWTAVANVLLNLDETLMRR